jgi:hypothetical protein
MGMARRLIGCAAIIAAGALVFLVVIILPY